MSFYGRVRGLKEGDTPTFLHLINRGPGDPDHPEWGGWGGRFVNKSGTRHYFPAADWYDGVYSDWAAVFRYRADFQEDFALRSRWCLPDSPVSSYPRVKIAVPDVSLKPGQIMEIEALFDTCQTNTRQIDTCQSDIRQSEETALTWSWYPEAGTFRHGLFFRETSGPKTGFMTERDVPFGGDVHIIVKAARGAWPRYISYARRILHIEDGLAVY